MDHAGAVPTSELDLWNRRCDHDEVRQAFVLPMLRALVELIRPATLIDLGAKTGYVPAALLDSHRDALKMARFIAVDRDVEAVEYMRGRFRGERVEVVQASIDEWARMSGKAVPGERRLHVLSYTALELDDDELRAVFASVTAEDSLVVVLPDVAEDAAAAGRLRQFLAGDSVRLSKIDRFTGRPYPFVARRLESWLGWAIDAGLRLREMRTYRTLDGHRHFTYEFCARP